jgi:hypothetical protein
LRGILIIDYFAQVSNQFFLEHVCNFSAFEEAIVKPKIGPKCKLTGGKWISAYDGKTITNASQLDVDHLVPLAEAWRSGAWKWTPVQRQTFANDLEIFNSDINFSTFKLFIVLCFCLFVYANIHIILIYKQYF